MDSLSEISKLHHDILWYIFMLNSHPITSSFDKDARYLLNCGTSPGTPLQPSLITNRRTSQVCKQWREIMLNSPSIWGNALDLQYLNQEGDQWREEVFSRTGDAPLSVIGVVGNGGRNTFALPFFLRLLDVHWGRIRSLVTLSGDANVDGRLHASLTRPAPLLQHFVVEFNATPTGNSGKIPFANHAPSLSSFNVPNQLIDLSSTSWASNIRHLNLRWSQNTIAISKLLYSLEKMPLLEHLIFRDTTVSLIPNPADLTVTMPRINLPRLRHLFLEERTNTPAPNLLSHVTIPPDCTLAIMSTSLDHNARGYSDYVKAHLSSWNITDIFYEVNASRWPAELQQMLGGNSYWHHVYMKRGSEDEPHFEYCGLSMVFIFPFYMAEALSSCNLDDVTTFRLKLDVDDIEEFLQDPSFDKLYDLLGTLNSVETFETNETTLVCLLTEEPSLDDFLFPNLKTIIVDTWELGIEGFLQLYKEDRPLSRVLFPEKTQVPIGDPTVLEEASKFGITVGWMTKDNKDVREFPPSSGAASGHGDVIDLDITGSD